MRINHRNKGHAFVAVAEDFDATLHKSMPLISSFVYTFKI